MKKHCSLLFIILSVCGCSDISHITRGDNFFNQGNYSAAVQEYEKVVALTSDAKSPYYGLPTGEDAKKKIELANLAILTKEQFSKGNQEFWKGNIQKAAEYYQEIDPQFLSEQENSVYEKNRKEMLTFLALTKKEAPSSSSETAQDSAAASSESGETILSKKVESSSAAAIPPAVSSAPAEIETAAAPEPNPLYYFPLNPGWKYHYRSSIPIGQKVIYQSLEEEILSEKIVQDKKVIPIQRRQSGRATEMLYYEIQKDQILLIAEQKASQAQPVFLRFPLVEIKSPVAIGSSWSAEGKPRVIIGLEHVAVGSGKYLNCLKVMELSELVKTVRWYAPNIGLVKQEKTNFPGKSYESQFVSELALLEK